MTGLAFFKITFEMTLEAAAEAVVSAGGKATSEELAGHIDVTRFRQRVFQANAKGHIFDMAARGYHVVNVEACTGGNDCRDRLGYVHLDPGGCRSSDGGDGDARDH